VARPEDPQIEEPALRDLKEIEKDTVDQWGEAQKERYLSKINARIKTVALQPRMGTARDDFGQGVRSIVSGKHLILYRIKDGRVHITRIVHQSQDLQREIERGRSKDMDIGR